MHDFLCDMWLVIYECLCMVSYLLYDSCISFKYDMWITCLRFIHKVFQNPLCYIFYIRIFRYKVLFYSKKCVIKHEHDKDIEHIGFRENNDYMIDWVLWTF